MYRPFERRVARAFDSYPQVRKLAKLVYLRAKYYLSAKRVRTLELDPRAKLYDVLPSDSSADGDYFFGYFGTPPWSGSGRYFILHRVSRHRPETADILLVDTWEDQVQLLGETVAWSYQQGSMAQWLPGSTGETVIFNDVVDGQLGSRLISLGEGERWIPWPVQAVHPKEPCVLSINYRRLWKHGSEYGYQCPAKNFDPACPDDKDGLWHVCLNAGEAVLLFSLAMLRRNSPRADMEGANHKVNHALYSPSGKRFVFLHRWVGRRGKFSRLYVAESDGTGLRLLCDNRVVSHYTWRDDDILLTWARNEGQADQYFLINVQKGERHALGTEELDRYGDGHPTYSPDRRWIVTDTYPDQARIRRLLLVSANTGRTVQVGSFHSPWRFDGAVRCDLHPRWHPDGGSISIDSTHGGMRRSYLVDVSAIVGG